MAGATAAFARRLLLVGDLKHKHIHMFGGAPFPNRRAGPPAFLMLASVTLSTTELAVSVSLPVAGWERPGLDAVGWCEHQAACAVLSLTSARVTHSLKEVLVLPVLTELSLLLWGPHSTRGHRQ